MPTRTPPETRSQGAHFLRDGGRAAARIVEAAALRPGDQVLDVGAGRGALTSLLAAAVQPGGAVTAIEKDPAACRMLEGRALPGTIIVAGDALRVAWPAHLDAVVANPPFRILPGLLRRIAAQGCDRAVLVVPAELAHRLVAAPGSPDYGKLTVETALRGKTALLFPLPPRAFDPPPEVACAVIRFRPRPPQPGSPGPVLDSVIAAAWDQRRRTLRHSLAPLAATLRVPPQTVTSALEACHASGRTASEVAPWEFAVMARVLAAQGAVAPVAGGPRPK